MRKTTETLSYTFNLNTSYHPRTSYKNDIKALGDKYICLVGQGDELMEPAEYKKIMSVDRVKIIANEKHLPIVCNQDVMKAVVIWMDG